MGNGKLTRKIPDNPEELSENTFFSGGFLVQSKPRNVATLFIARGEKESHTPVEVREKCQICNWVTLLKISVFV